MLKSILFPLKRAGGVCPAPLLQHLPCLLSFLRVHRSRCLQHTCAPMTLPHAPGCGSREAQEPAGVWHVLSTQPKRFPSFLEKFYIKGIMSCRLLVSALMLSFKQNFLDWLLGGQPNVRALGGQAAPLRSKASLSQLAGASHGQLSPLAGPRLHQRALLILPAQLLRCSRQWAGGLQQPRGVRSSCEAQK